MSCVLRIPDGYGGYVGDRHQMRARPGSHTAYARASDLVVEWYDFGEDAPYESANLLVFDRSAQKALLAALHLESDRSPDTLASDIATAFSSYFDVRRFAEAQHIDFSTETDFYP